MSNEKSNLSKEDILKFREVFDLLYSKDEQTGEFVTYSEVVKYIYSNKLYNTICKVIDSGKLTTLLNGKALFDLSKVIRIYIAEYNKKEAIILNYLENCMGYLSNKNQTNFSKLKRKFNGYNFPSVKDIEKYIIRFSKLGFIDLKENVVKDILEQVENYKNELAIEREKREFEKIKNVDKYNITLKKALYIPVIKKAYLDYKNGLSIDDICDQINGCADTFYNDINFIKDEIDSEYRVFAQKLANYNYNKFLMKKYKIDLINYDYANIDDLCEHISSNYKGSPDMLCNNFETYIKMSKFVNEKQIKFIRWVEKVYTRYYEEKLENRRKERNDIKIKEAAQRVELYVVSNSSDDYDLKKLNQDISFLKKNNYPRLEIYLELISKKEFDKAKDVIETAKEMAILIENGIDMNGIKRNFDMIDYFLMTNLSFQQFLKIVKDHISYKDHYILINFFKKKKINFNWNENYIEQAYAAEYLTNIKLDDEGNIISGRKVSLEEKKAVVEALNRINVPINEETYCDGISRLNQGILYASLEEQLSSKVKSK